MPTGPNGRTANLLSQVRARVGEQSEQEILTAAILAHLNEAQHDLCLQLSDAALYALQCEYEGTLTLDGNPYDLPSDFMRERVLKYKTIVARRWPVYKLDALYGTDAYSTPSATNPFWYLWGNQLRIMAGAPSAGSYYLHYYRVPADMTTDATSSPSHAMEFDGLLVLFAVSRVREGQGQLDESERLWQEYLDRCAVINSRYGGAMPYDGLAGDGRA